MSERLYYCLSCLRDFPKNIELFFVLRIVVILWRLYIQDKGLKIRAGLLPPPTRGAPQENVINVGLNYMSGIRKRLPGRILGLLIGKEA